MSSAFTYDHHQQHPPFLLESVFYQNNNNNNSIKPSSSSSNGFVDDQSSVCVVDASSCFSQFYPQTHHVHDHPLHQEITIPSFVADVNIEQQLSSEIANGSLSDNNDFSAFAAAAVKKQTSDSSSVLQIDHLESGEQVTQMLTSSNDKKKNRDAFANSQPPKDARDGEVKKQRKCNGPLKDEEKKKHSKADKKDPKKVAAEAPKGYIHVRARRGQATDSHSLAERVRREKISERMKLLQSLVPACDKVTGKALMLDEIINYVQSLQNQVEFLSMKLASVNPMLYNFGMDVDTFMIRTERLNSLASLLPSMQQQCNSTMPTAFADTNGNFSTTNNFPLLDTSSSALLLQQGQRPSALIQDSGNVLWDVDDQRQKLFNQSGFNTNLISFH